MMKPDYGSIQAEFTIQQMSPHENVPPVLRERQKLVRTSNFVSIRRIGSDEEWLFVRTNGGHSDINAFLVDHTSRLLFPHAAKNLRERNIAGSWREIEAFPLDVSLLERARPSGSEETAFGFQFRRFVCDPWPGQTRSAEFWWNDGLELPLRIRVLDEEMPLLCELTALKVERDTWGLALSCTLPGYGLARVPLDGDDSGRWA